MQIGKEINELTSSYTEIKKKFTNDLKDKLKTAFSEFFNKYPEIDTIKWTQFTPYFNDGDPCVFSVNDFEYIHKNALDDEDYEKYNYDWGEGDYSISTSRWHHESTYQNDLEKEFLSKYSLDEWMEDITIFKSIPDEIFESLGEGLVIVNRNGITIEEWDHE